MSTQTEKGPSPAQECTNPTIVYIDPEDFEQHVAPLLRQPQNRGLRATILKAIMQQRHAMIRVLLNPDWSSIDPVTGLPTAYSLDRIDSLPRHLYAVLKATGRLKDDHGDYADRACWRRAVAATH